MQKSKDGLNDSLSTLEQKLFFFTRSENKIPKSHDFQVPNIPFFASLKQKRNVAFLRYHSMWFSVSKWPQTVPKCCQLNSNRIQFDWLAQNWHELKLLKFVRYQMFLYDVETIKCVWYGINGINFLNTNAKNRFCFCFCFWMGKKKQKEQINGDSSKSICIRLVGGIFTGKHLNFFSIFMRFEEFLLKWVQFFNSKCLPAISAITYENVTLLRWKSKKHTKVCTTSHRLLDHHNVKNACMNKSCYFF